MSKILFISLFVTSIFTYANAQHQPFITNQNRVDSTIRQNRKLNLDIPCVLIAGGIAAYQFDKHFYGLKDFYLPTFKHSYDDYTQYLPAAVMLGMKAVGIEGRSSWEEMLVADAFSIAIMAGAVNILKYTVKKERPDNSANNSFPSGHTATVFMTATMLHKEYGHKSPWISVGSYTCATLTGLTRQLNNKHWMSDVIVGAGIGILSVELGYLLSDLIFNRGKSKSYFYSSQNTIDSKPSFIGVQMGVKNHLREYLLKDNRELSIDYGSYVGLESAWYLNKNWGLGGQINISSHLYDIDGEQQIVPFGMFSTTIGPYYSLPISSYFRFENKALLGVGLVQRNKSIDENIDLDHNINYTFGTAFSYWSRQNISLKLFGEYKLIPDFINGKTGSELSVGMSVNYMF